MPLLIVHSPKGGVGCTTVAANLAAWLARGGRPIVAIDFSPYESLALHLERGQRQQPSGVEIWSRAQGHGRDRLIARIDEMLTDERVDDMLMIADIPSGDQATLDALAGRCLIRLCVLAADAGSAALLPSLLRSAPAGADEARIHYVLNMLDERRSVAREFHRLLGAAAGEDLVAVIRRDEAVNEALAMLMPVHDHAPASAAALDLTGLADRVAASLDIERSAQETAS
ncbi:hypothetical protein CLG96_05160 [Sphingomonas oleivorans]|uniref:CobQ/CobB/MinD/ParA nucleotide binding domain-containing protein n=1 Tax=Sphingomonas oleivorans TaxID=1735121 RepID=A0A2T5G2V6_9SPHN|nr:cellulose synthase operon protein YhjQ/BcsQ [Sphingomonas oleivorans]PTQ13478.1 hypothetical protein CLG96_05160 [Sphingomonas oleivorans]